MLLGEFEHTIDDKSRLTLPARFRSAFADGIVVTRGMDGCLYAYTQEAWDDLVATRLAALDPLSQDDRRIQRHFFAGAIEAELDRQGRVGLPAALVQHAGLGREVVVAGVNDHVEIWDREAWRRELAVVEGSAEDVAERLAKRD
ncbi:MAG TPA: division/cell wall cluster transcriptional repressor MraZ [Gaiellaceae bacterium]|jgi:MraZ protein|nr:division/cell wall cluster transcriptional repressor MraZ [Gaiellaceae bacterium]